MKPRASEGLRPTDRLRQRADYLACYNRGRAVTGPFSTLHILPNSYGWPRLGVTATRKMGNAVVRNRLRRRCREVYRRWRHRSELPALDIVVNLRHRAATADFHETRRQLERQLDAVLAMGRKEGAKESGA